MQQLTSVQQLRAWRSRFDGNAKRIAFVPTMGNLHEGHLALVREAGKLADIVIVSIFVNPLQFGANEDLDSYPRTPQEDSALLQNEAVDCLFYPGVQDMYPRGQQLQTFVEVPGISNELCGASRPGHFRGVATVVCRLFNLVQPHIAVFGKKDYQQLLVIRLMTQDLGIPCQIIGVDTVREADGLAMSSRNNYLGSRQRQQAPALYQALGAVKDCLLETGQYHSSCEQAAMQQLAAAGFAPDYLSVRRRSDLAIPQPGDRELVILAAAFLGETRLIDNLEVDLNLPG